MADIPHIAWPFRLAANRLAQVEQDSIEDVEQNVRAYLATPKGARPLSPDFGLEDLTFAPGTNADRVASEIIAAEDGRADVTITTTPPDGTGRVSVTVAVDLAE